MVKSKSDQLSIKHKEFGNTLLRKQEHFMALGEYNKALLFAESKENIANAYANRSAVYLDVKKYDECLQNIQWARENGYPADKIQKLNEREEKCKKFKAEQVVDPLEEVRDFFKLSYPPNPKIPFIADCLYMGTDKSKSRRGVFTNRDLKPGDIIACERGIFGNSNEGMSHIRCCNCLKMNMANLIPCTKTATLMFCSEKCREETYAKVQNLDSMVTASEHIDINPERLLRECDEAFGGREGLLKFLKGNKWLKLKCTVFDFDFSNPDDPNYKANLIKCLLSMGIHNLDEKECLEMRLNSGDDFIEKCQALAGDDKVILRFLLRLGMICEHNGASCTFDANTVYEREDSAGILGLTQPNTEKENSHMHMINVFAFISHIHNHCNPNTIDVATENGYFTFVQKPIKAGEELFKSYMFGIGGGKHFDKYDKEYAQLKRNDCECISCTTGCPDIPIKPTQSILMDEIQLDLATKKLMQISDYTPQHIKSYKPFIDCVKANWALLEAYYSKFPQTPKTHPLANALNFVMCFLSRILFIPCAPAKYRYKPYERKW